MTTEPIILLGIHDGHNSGASLVVDGRVMASVSEERLSRRKNDVGYPVRSIDEVLRIGGVTPKDLTEVVYASLFMHKQDYLTELEPWYCVGLEDQRRVESQPKDYQKLIFEQRKQDRIDQVRDHLGVEAARVRFVEHHLAHAAAAIYSAPNGADGRPLLALTCDGAGDGLCATVSTVIGGRIERIASTNRHASLGKIYSRVTMLMGMTPWEHEYKLMGMAPYASPDRVEKAVEKLRTLLRLSKDGLSFEQVGELSTNYCYEFLRDSFERVRFDTIAGTVQAFTEELLLEWVRNCIRHTGIGDVVCGGGVFMNVKANMLLGELPEVKSLYVMPSGGDESLSIGATLLRHAEITGSRPDGRGIFENLYFGAGYSEAQERQAAREAAEAGLTVLEAANPDSIGVDLLAAGEIVARCRGRMEWGARALGNRSINAAAHEFGKIEELNSSIKMRDFWMPFAPSIRAESAGRYIRNDKAIDARFMTMAFPVVANHGDLKAASHPRDGTIRPQLVTAEANPQYHALLTAFEARTGRGGFLNTSFNLHGEPIVNTPSEAVDVLLRSGLKHLVLDRHVIRKPSPA